MIKYFIVILVFGIINPLSVFSQNNSFHLYPNYIDYLNAKDSLTKNVFYFKAKTDEKIVCLSFDDGPSMAYTEKLIAFLKEKKCPAVFFIIGNKVKKNQIALYQDSLFEIGSHSYNHYDYRKVLGVDSMIVDFKNSVDLHATFSYEKLKWYRPPHGVINDTIVNVMKDFELQGVLWSFDTMDFLSPSKQEILDNINHFLSNGDIILLHEKIDLELLNSIIKSIRKKEFKIVKLSELIKYQNVIP